MTVQLQLRVQSTCASIVRSPDLEALPSGSPEFHRAQTSIPLYCSMVNGIQLVRLKLDIGDVHTGKYPSGSEMVSFRDLTQDMPVVYADHMKPLGAMLGLLLVRAWANC